MPCRTDDRRSRRSGQPSALAYRQRCRGERRPAPLADRLDRTVDPAEDHARGGRPLRCGYMSAGAASPPAPPGGPDIGGGEQRLRRRARSLSWIVQSSRSRSPARAFGASFRDWYVRRWMYPRPEMAASADL